MMNVNPDNSVKFDWWMREAMRQAWERKTIRRDRLTKRGVAKLVELGLLQLVKETAFSKIYALTEKGKRVAPSMPSRDLEWSAMGTDDLRDFRLAIPEHGSSD